VDEFSDFTTDEELSELLTWTLRKASKGASWSPSRFKALEGVYAMFNPGK
jgi:hypothetical protein